MRLNERGVSPIRLVLIPLIVYTVWFLETFLLEGSLGVFSRYQPVVYFTYVLLANILIGTLAPLIFLRSGLLTGVVNMHQIGFRDLRRTVVTAGITACSGYLILAAVTHSAAPTVTLVGTVLVLTPVAISSVMICWVLAGTHLQAYARRYGAAASILTGVTITGSLFGLSFAAHSPPLSDPRHILTAIVIGAAVAIVFFAIRDVWSAIIVQLFALVWFLRDSIDSAYIQPVPPLVVLTASLAILALLLSIRYLTKRFVTILLPVRAGPS